MPKVKKLHWTTERQQLKEVNSKLLEENKMLNDRIGKTPISIAATANACPPALTPQEKINRFELQKIDSSWRLQEFMREFFEKGVRLSSRKNHDYAGNGDPFYNFRRFGMQGFIVRMGDKFARLETLATHGYLAVTEESYSDTLLDIANYAALLAAFLYNQQIEVQERNKVEQPR